MVVVVFVCFVGFLFVLWGGGFVCFLVGVFLVGLFVVCFWGVVFVCFFGRFFY